MVSLPMQNEQERSNTFTNWQASYINTQGLVKDGFYYTGYGDVVRCAFCLVEIGCWEEEDNPNAEHKRCSPGCPYLIECTRRNSTRRNSRNLTSDSADTDAHISQALKKLNVNPQTGPLKYSSFEERLESFKNWPEEKTQKPEDLAAAGFFYVGVADHTLCFSCRLGLKDWQDSEDVFEEHLTWASKCSHVQKLMKK